MRGRNFLGRQDGGRRHQNLSLTGYQVIKYTLDESKYDGGAKNINSIPLIRYAEVLLNYAEAQAELGGSPIPNGRSRSVRCVSARVSRAARRRCPRPSTATCKSTFIRT